MTEKQFQEHLKQYCKIQQQIDKLELQLNHKVSLIKDSYGHKIDQLKSQSTELTNSIQSYAASHPQLFPKHKKSFETDQLILGYRSSSELILPEISTLISQLKNHGYAHLINIQEKIKKTSLKQIPKDLQEKLQIHQKQTEQFYITIKKEQYAKYY